MHRCPLFTRGLSLTGVTGNTKKQIPFLKAAWRWSRLDSARRTRPSASCSDSTRSDSSPRTSRSGRAARLCWKRCGCGRRGTGVATWSGARPWSEISPNLCTHNDFHCFCSNSDFVVSLTEREFPENKVWKTWRADHEPNNKIRSRVEDLTLAVHYWSSTNHLLSGKWSSPG